jgi:hypothetical protein
MFPRSILYKWINQKTLLAAPYGSAWKSSHASPLHAGNSASKASTSVGSKIPERRASSILLGAVETGAVGGAIPSLVEENLAPSGGWNVRQRFGRQSDSSLAG